MTGVQTCALPISKLLLSDFAGRGDREAAGVRAEMTSALEVFLNPMVREATNRSDFTFDQFWQEKCTCYINVEPPEGLMAQRLLALVYQQAIDAFLRAGKYRERKKKIRAHIVIDELSKLHYMPVLVDSLTHILDYGVQLSLIAQGDSQLVQRYGQDAAETIFQNCGMQMIFAPNDLKMCKRISEQLGTTEIERPTSSRSYNASGGSTTVGRNRTQVPLMTPEQVWRIDKRKAILFPENERAAIIHKLVARKDFRFKRLIKRTPHATRRPIRTLFGSVLRLARGTS